MSHSARLLPPVTEQAAPRAPDVLIKIDLDDRCFLFPSAKNVSHLQVLVYRGEKVRLEAVYPYNVSQTPAELIELKPQAVAEFSRKLVDTVYRAGSVLYIAGNQNIAVATLANGYSLQVGDSVHQRDLFISTSCIWRLCGALCRASDLLATPQAH
jgi:hypothetical protein